MKKIMILGYINNVCEECIIGAGDVVIKNIEESGTYVGVPAKRI